MAEPGGKHILHRDFRRHFPSSGRCVSIPLPRTRNDLYFREGSHAVQRNDTLDGMGSAATSDMVECQLLARTRQRHRCSTSHVKVRHSFLASGKLASTNFFWNSPSGLPKEDWSRTG